jgi:hypothetical protein
MIDSTGSSDGDMLTAPQAIKFNCISGIAP